MELWIKIPMYVIKKVYFYNNNNNVSFARWHRLHEVKQVGLEGINIDIQEADNLLLFILIDTLVNKLPLQFVQKASRPVSKKNTNFVD